MIRPGIFHTVFCCQKEASLQSPIFFNTLLKDHWIIIFNVNILLLLDKFILQNFKALKIRLSNGTTLYAIITLESRMESHSYKRICPQNKIYNDLCRTDPILTSLILYFYNRIFVQEIQVHFCPSSATFWSHSSQSQMIYVFKYFISSSLHNNNSFILNKNSKELRQKLEYNYMVYPFL